MYEDVMARLVEEFGKLQTARKEMRGVHSFARGLVPQIPHFINNLHNSVAKLTGEINTEAMLAVTQVVDPASFRLTNTSAIKPEEATMRLLCNLPHHLG